MSQEQLRFSPQTTGLDAFSFQSPEKHVTTRMRVPARSPSVSPVITSELAREKMIDEKWGKQAAASKANTNEQASR